MHASPAADLYAAAARDADRARGLGLSGPAYPAYDDLLADPDVETVYISLTNDLHARWSIAGARPTQGRESHHLKSARSGNFLCGRSDGEQLLGMTASECGVR